MMFQNTTTNLTTEKENLSTTNLPLEGYPLLLMMDVLKEWDKVLSKRISDLRRATSDNKGATTASARKKGEMKKLEQERNENTMRFNSLIPHVQEFADLCGQYDANYSAIVKAYYCDINKRTDKTKDNIKNDLQAEIDKYIQCTAHNFKVTLQTIWINNLIKRE